MTAPSAPRRITLVSARNRVDVSLPAESTLAELLPQMVRITGASAEPDRIQPVPGWTLGRLGAPPLDPARTVAATGIRDGEVLYLKPRDDRSVPLLFDDVVDAIASAAHDRPGVWRPALARRVGLAAAAAGFVCAAVLLGLAGPRWPWPALVTGVLALVLLVAGGALARAQGDSAAGAVLAGAGLPAALLAGMEVFVSGPSMVDPGAGELSFGLAATVVYAVLAVVLVVDRSAWFVGAGLAAMLGCLAASVAAVLPVGAITAYGHQTRPSYAVAAVTLVVALAVAPALPMLALRLGRLPLPRIPTDVEAFRHDEKPTLGPDVIHETRTAEEVLTGVLGALAVVAAGCALVLLRGGSGWGCLLTAVAGLVLTLRSRAYAGAGQRLVLFVPGLLLLVGAAARVAANGNPGARLAVIAVALLAAVGAALYAVRVVGRDPSPYWSRLLDVLEFLCLVGLVPVAAAVLDLYQAVRSLGG